MEAAPWIDELPQTAACNALSWTAGSGWRGQPDPLQQPTPVRPGTGEFLHSIQDALPDGGTPAVPRFAQAECARCRQTCARRSVLPAGTAIHRRTSTSETLNGADPASR